MSIVGCTHLHAQPDAFVVFLGQVENKLEVIRQFEAARARLDLAPRWTNIKLLPQGKRTSASISLDTSSPLISSVPLSAVMYVTSPLP